MVAETDDVSGALVLDDGRDAGFTAALVLLTAVAFWKVWAASVVEEMRDGGGDGLTDGDAGSSVVNA